MSCLDHVVLCRDHISWCRDRVTTDLNRYPKLVESYFSLGFSYYPPISDTAFFPWLNFCIFLLLSLSLKGSCFFWVRVNVLTGYWHVMVLKCKRVNLLKSAKREIRSIALICQFLFFSFFFHEETSFDGLNTNSLRLSGKSPLPWPQIKEANINFAHSPSPF